MSVTDELLANNEEYVANLVRDKFPTAALATLEFHTSWRELAPGSAELVSFVKPKELSEAGTAGA